jgi:hypothetical protein
MMRLILTLAVLAMAGTALAGCRAEVERTHTNIAAPR